MPDLDPTHLHPNSRSQLQINTVDPVTILRVVFGLFTCTQRQQLLSAKHRVQDGRIFVSLVKWRQRLRTKSLIFIVSIGLDVVVIYSNPLVWISDGDVEGKIVLQHVVCGVPVELRQSGVGDVEFEVTRAEDEPDYESGDANHDDDSEDEFENEAQNAIAEAAEQAATAAAAATIAAGSVVIFAWWWD